MENNILFNRKKREMIINKENISKREHKFAYFWYDEPHIFEWTQRDFDSAIKKYADIGINHIIDFSITHIRWSFYPYKEIINSALEKLIKACHKNNIYLTEHHSSVLLFCTDTPERIEFMQKRFFGKRNGSYKNWPNFVENCLHGIEVDGKNLNDMLQIDPITGKPFVIDEWGTYRICTNHPDFTPLYLKYLEELYALGIDGIMTDDISMVYHPNVNGRKDVPHGCACKFCRAQFKKETGYILPSCGVEWAEWREKRDSADYIAWLKFRKESVRNFHVKVKEHYESLGLQLFRPNYSATTIHWTNPGGYCFDLLPALDWVMIENTFEHITRYSWPEWMIEHNHRFALARYREIPAAAMFYPHRKDELSFCWALAMNSGIGYLGTANCEPVDLNTWEKPLRAFEYKQQNSIIRNKKIAKTGFYFSRLTRDLYPDYEGRSRENLTTWMLACEFENIPYDMLLPEELEHSLNSFSLIILNEAAVMSETELTAFKTFVEKGGRILWIGENAAQDEMFVVNRSFEDVWGFSASREWQAYGKGQVKSLALEEYTNPLRRRVTAPLRMIKDNEPNYDYQELTAEDRKTYNRIAVEIIDARDGLPDLEIKDAQPGLLFHPFINESEDQLLIHILNAVGTLDKPKSGYVMDCDPIPFPALDKTVQVTIRKPEVMMNSDSGYKAVLCVPEQEEITLNLMDAENYFKCELPAGSFNFYAMIKIMKNML